MSLFFKLFGIGAILFSAALVSHKYCLHITERADLTRAFYELLADIKGKISVYLLPPAELVRGFRSELLSRVGFISLAEELRSPADAYFKIKESISLSEGCEKILDGYFTAFKKSYKDELTAQTAGAMEALWKTAEAETGSLSREKKLARTVIFAIALGAVILIV